MEPALEGIRLGKLRQGAAMVADLAWFTPLYHLVNICRAFSAGHISGVIGSAVWITVVAVVLAVIPFRLMKRRVIQ